LEEKQMAAGNATVVLTFGGARANLCGMNPPVLRVRRATTDDLQSLKALWRSMRLAADDLEKRLTEFQVVEDADGKLLGAVGVQIVRQHARLHSEGYLDFAHADAARELFWKRIQTLASNHGVFRLWTQENSPYWLRSGFRAADAKKLSDLPPEWREGGGEWFMFQLKDEEAIAKALDKDFAAFMSAERRNTERAYERARTLKIIITVIGFLIGILGFGVVGYLLVHNHPVSPGH
jgi:N-acetylglutamate synthase-like GNAT family acetyltransferase